MTKDDCGIAITSARACGRVTPRRSPFGRFSALPVLVAKTIRGIAAIGISITLVACGGGGGGAASQVPITVLGVSSPRASQAGIGQGEAVLAFRVALDGTVVYPVEVSFTASSSGINTPASAILGASCSAGVDYYIPVVSGLSMSVNATNNTGGGKLTIATSSSVRRINVMVCPGNSVSDKAVQLAWGGGGSSGTATGSILGASNNNLAGSDHLNDTGITSCANGASNGFSCPQADFPGQDADSGRDATLSITGSGVSRTSAFAFTQLPSASGIQDNVTGLLWEGKTTDNGLHDMNSTFTWFNSTATVNGGAAGTVSGGTCTGVPAGCDTEKFVAAVNAERLYGFSDWRLPTVQELSSLVNSGAGTAPTVDASILNQFAGEYWSSSPKAADAGGAWVVDFNSGAVGSIAKSSARRVRLVRGR
jgi:hypothetical protein